MHIVYICTITSYLMPLATSADTATTRIPLDFPLFVRVLVAPSISIVAAMLPLSCLCIWGYWLWFAVGWGGGMRGCVGIAGRGAVWCGFAGGAESIGCPMRLSCRSAGVAGSSLGRVAARIAGRTLPMLERTRLRGPDTANTCGGLGIHRWGILRYRPWLGLMGLKNPRIHNDYSALPGFCRDLDAIDWHCVIDKINWI